MAVVLQGYIRVTADIDLVVDLEPADARRVIEALISLGLRARVPEDPAEEGFRDLGLVHGYWKRLKTATPFDFMPLYAGLLTPADPRVAAMVEQLTDPERFWTSYPTPSVSAKEPSFDPKAYWRGTSWVNVNYFLARGLLQYGRPDLARTLIERTLAMVERGGMREFFDPGTGEGFRAKNFSWTAALVLELNDMLEKLPPS